MIYLITGSPGTGKTAMVLSWIRKNHDGLFKYPVLMGVDDKGNEIYENMPRPIFVNDIDDIDHKFFGTQDISDDEIKADAIENVVPTPTASDPSILPPVLIIDEAHRIYPVRSATAKNPPYVESLAKLRHHGVTLILLTQHPSTIDKFVRDRIGKHVHIIRSKVGSKSYTFYDVQNTLSKSALQSEGMMDFYTIDKQVFEHYKSASTHVKFKKKTQKILFLFPAIILMLIVGFTMLYFNFGNLANFAGSPEQEISTIPQTDLDRQMASNAIGANNATQTVIDNNQSVANNATYDKNPLTPEAMTPRYQEQPESKPMYDDLRKPKSFEYPVAIIESKGHCKAYSEQGTLLDIPQNFCKKWLRDGRFNPYREPVRQQEQPSQPQQAQTQSSSILALSDSTKHDEMRPSIHLDAQ